MSSSYIDQGGNNKRLISFILVVAMHAGLGYALVTGLARSMVEAVAPPIVVDIIEEIKPKEDEPPPPPPKIDQKVFIPPPVIDIQTIAPPPAPVAITPAPPPPPPPPQAAPVKQVVRTSASYDPRIARRGDYQPEYPAQSKRLGEEGTTTLNLCVGADGKPEAGTVQVSRSSGFPSLDNAAVSHFQRRQPKFKTATEDGQPVRSCFTIPVRFRLEEAR